ncbi:glycosyltransferase [Altererythrobacter salegens]|uniref:Glycosyltransferase n=1 Tax=Croceibacterium salegens TaxID=1737568 RepID=A0A6I4SZU0_9SPHN|nr:glycosyltransferase [Croceibacterium salegens]MXO60557.1 glycosyltransferase [Croceibacterium salegens]
MTTSELPTVVYLGNFELPDRNAAALRVRGNARIFRDLGYRVVLVGVSRDTAGEDLSSSSCESGDQGIEAWAMAYPSGTGEWMRRITSIRPLIEVVERADISRLALVICYNYPAVAQLRIAHAARRLGAKAVADVTEWYGRVPGRSPACLVKNIDTLLRMYLVNPAMEGLITTSSFMSDYYQPTGLPIVEIPTLQRGDPGPPRASTGSAAKKLFFAGSGFDPALVTQGREGLKDRLDWVLELLFAAAKLGAVFEMDLFGVTRENYLAIVPEHADLIAGLGDALRFRGRVPHADLLDTLRRADFSIFMRQTTRVTLAGFPTKFSESVAYGTPAITNPMPSLTNYLIEGETGFTVDPSDPGAAARHLTEILSMPAGEVAAMKQACARSSQFDYATFVEPVADWLAELGLDAARRRASANCRPMKTV